MPERTQHMSFTLSLATRSEHGTDRLALWSARVYPVCCNPFLRVFDDTPRITTHFFAHHDHSGVHGRMVFSKRIKSSQHSALARCLLPRQAPRPFTKHQLTRKEGRPNQACCPGGRQGPGKSCEQRFLCPAYCGPTPSFRFPDKAGLLLGPSPAMPQREQEACRRGASWCLCPDH